MLNPSGEYYAYLRKSREDFEAEKQGAGETLARHEAQLRETASRLNITISQIYREVVSGETIAARPEMLRMLDDIETNRPDGVLVTEIPRLARGDTRDQGLVMETFKYANTHIITPMKVYNPNDEFDEEYAEFGLFMSRREYANIKRRLHNGKIASVKEGKFAGSQVPYGYERYKLPGEKGFSLRIVPEQAQVVRLIYEMYINGTPESDNKPVSATAIARILNEIGIPTLHGGDWLHGVVRTILTNTTYIGMVHWGKRKTVKVIKDGIMQKSNPMQKEYVCAPGRHEAIIDRDSWEAAQKAFTTRSKPFPDKRLQNSLASVLLCGQCQHSMKRRPAKRKESKDWMICTTRSCPTCGSDFALVENRVVDALSEWLRDYKLDHSFNNSQSSVVGLDVLNASLASKSAELEALDKQIKKTYTLLETDVYTLDIFRERHSDITGKIAEVEKEITGIETMIKSYSDLEEKKKVIIPKCEYLLTHYWELLPEERNTLLKGLVSKIEYHKITRGNKRETVDFRLNIYPLL